MNENTHSIEQYLAQFAQERGKLPGSTLPWMRDIREAALARFAELGFPTPRNEEWKYTPVAPIERRAFQSARRVQHRVTAEQVRSLDLIGVESHVLVFVNGLFAPELSLCRDLPKGVAIGSLAMALEHEPEVLKACLADDSALDGHTFSALNRAFMADGAYVHLPPGTVLDNPIHLIFVSTAQQNEAHLAHPHNVVAAEDNSKATIIESYIGLDEGGYFTNAVSEIIVGKNAVIEHYKLQQENLKAFHVAMLQVRLDRDSNFSSHSLSLGGALVRNDIRALLDAEGADCTLNGLYVAGGRQHVDNHTRIDHMKPHGTSREYYKGILDGAARGVFNGKVIVHQDAQKTDANQSNKNLLLSESAEVDTKPQLEIYADDVKCTHGATVGQLDSDVVFYLQSRGINEEDARSLLTYAFASDIVSRIKVAALRSRLDEILLTRLPKGDRIKEFA